MNLVIVGSVAIDDVETPSGRCENSMGGSAVFASIAASKFTEVGLVGVVGDDYPDETCELLQKQGIDLKGLEKVSGKTFRWKGIYNDLNRAETLDTQLNVFADFAPKLPDEYLKAEFLFLGNIHPKLQLDVIEKAKGARIIACDTMNFWIQSTPELLNEVIKKVNILFINEEEIKLLTSKDDIFEAVEEILHFGPEYVIVKRGDEGAFAFNKKIDTYCPVIGTNHVPTYDFLFDAPVYEVEKVFDPTGAGDSFAGGFMGYLAKIQKYDPESIKKAMLHGTATASFNIESFSFDRLIKVSIKDLEDRIEALL